MRLGRESVSIVMLVENGRVAPVCNRHHSESCPFTLSTSPNFVDPKGTKLREDFAIAKKRVKKAATYMGFCISQR